MNRLGFVLGVVVAAGFLPTGSAAAQAVNIAAELEIVPAEAVGMSSEKLAQVIPKLQEFVDQEKVAGAIVIVARHGKIALFDSVGMKDLEHRQPMQKDTILRFYSMTKPITSVAIMMLVEDGQIGLDDPVSMHLPSLKGLKVFDGMDGDQMKLVEPTREMTIRDLLRHTSGLTYGFFGNTPVDQAYRTAGVLSEADALEDLATKLSKLPLLYQPGTTFNYSVSTDLLGHIVERVAGVSLAEFFGKRILGPLDMHDTAFVVVPENVDRFSDNFGPQQSSEGIKVIEQSHDSRFTRQPKHYSGGGGLTSTARDYMRFCQMLLNKGELHGTRYLKQSTVEEMTKNQLSESAYPIGVGGDHRPGVGFGLGFSVVQEITDWTQLCHVGEYGWGGAASTHFWISPQDDLAVLVLTQYMPFSFQLETAVKPIVYDAIID